MSLSDAENHIYQNAIKYVTELSLNLMAVKVTIHPTDFNSWCAELVRICRHELNKELLEVNQLPILKKFQTILENGFSTSQFKMARIAPWPIFFGFIQQQNDIHALDERLKLLSYMNDIREIPLAEMTELDRLVFAGKHTPKHNISVYNFDVEWFSSTKGAKVFHQLLQQQPHKFDIALSYIPLVGDVTFDQYSDFVKAYQEIFISYTQNNSKGEKAPLTPATRLLAMRRPDQFISISNNNLDVFCQGLSIPKFKNNDFNSYWHDMIATLRTFSWWHQEQPLDEKELELWKVRAILVDLFFYADEELALNSNYILLRDKSVKLSNRNSSVSVSRKRPQESVEMLVDRALESEDLPEYIQGKRDSIIKQVKAGKSVEQAIGLMRAIFG